MHEQFKSFNKLESELLERMKSRGYSSVTITGYRYLCNSIISWLQENGFSSYSQEGGDLFLQKYLDEHGSNQYYTNLRTVVFRLNDIINNTWKDVHSDKGKHFTLSDEYETIISQYCSRAIGNGLTTGTVKLKKYAISWFLHELGRLQCNSIARLSSKSITMACIKITDHNLWGEIRVFLRYLADFDITEADYSTIVPHYSKPYVIPSVYSVNEISRIENSVDISTTMGKRDYAMILLASRMGVRSSDIVKLKIEDVYNKNEINIFQQKTGNILHLPIIKEVQIAIKNYLAVRPASKIEQLFINAYAPYKAVTTGTLRNILKKYIIVAGINPGNRKKGPHIFRSSLASSMINDDASYETVRKILGHSSNNAIKHYARIDIEKLRQYCLKPPVPNGKFWDFLHGEVR